MAKTFKEDLKNLINFHSMENGSDTPDWILAEYLLGCIRVFESAMIDRETYYGRNAGSVKPEPVEAA